MKSVGDYLKEQVEQSSAEMSPQWKKIEQLHTDKYEIFVFLFKISFWCQLFKLNKA